MPEDTDPLLSPKEGDVRAEDRGNGWAQTVRWHAGRWVPEGARWKIPT